jgi:hypothetical protein
VLTLPQTVVLLALSRGEQPRLFPPITRIKLLNKKWIESNEEDGGEIGKPQFKITPEGLLALAPSPHLAKADRILQRETKHPPRQLTPEY